MRWHNRIGGVFAAFNYQEFPKLQAEDDLALHGWTIRYELLYFSRDTDWLFKIAVDKLVAGGSFRSGVHEFFLPDWHVLLSAVNYRVKSGYWNFDIKIVPPFDYEIAGVLRRKALNISLGISHGWWNKEN